MSLLYCEIVERNYENIKSFGSFRAEKFDNFQLRRVIGTELFVSPVNNHSIVLVADLNDSQPTIEMRYSPQPHDPRLSYLDSYRTDAVVTKF